MNRMSVARHERRRPARRKKNIRLYQEAPKRSRVWLSQRPRDTARLAARLVAAAPAHVWLLRGPLGSGKSTFARAALRSLRYRGTAPSPTYTLARTYRLPKGAAWDRVLHVDAYRLRGAHEEAALDLAEAGGDPRCLIIVEWPERLHSHPWDQALTIRFAHHTAGRRITLSRAL